MALLNELRAAIEWMGWYVLPFIFVMSVIVFFHELGHYLVGRWCGVKIDAFSLGFGPELYARVDKLGTRWRLAAIPLGGYVKFHGDANAASAPDLAGVEAMAPGERAQTLAGQPVRNRAAIVAAGPIANFVLAFVIFTALFMVFGRFEHSARIGAVEARIAGRAGRIPGGRSRRRDQRPAGLDVSGLAAGHDAEHRAADVVRRRAQRSSEKSLTATPQIAVVDQGPLGKRRMGHLGLISSRDPADVKFEHCAAPTCAVWGAQQVWFIVRATGAYVGRAVRRPRIGRQPFRTDRRVANRRRNGEDQPVAVVQPRRAVLGLGRPDELAADSPARRRPPVVLRVRSRCAAAP